MIGIALRTSKQESSITSTILILKLSGGFMPVILYTLYHTYILHTIFCMY